MGLIEQAKVNTKQNYRDANNCAESVLKAIIDTNITDFPPEVVALATGFGGNTCNALTGGIMGIGTVHGRRNPTDRELKMDERILYIGEGAAVGNAP